MMSDKAKKLGLPPPFPIVLSKINSRFGFYCYNADDRFMFINFHSAYAAKAFLDMIIDGAEYKWLRNNELLTEKGMRIRGEQSDDLERAIEHKLTPTEREWDVPDPLFTTVRQFIGRRVVVDDNVIKDPHEAVKVEQVTRTRAPKKERVPKPRDAVAKAKAKVKSGEHITISEICEELGHPPRVCRAILRELKVPKPDHGWAWSKSEAEKIRSRLKQRLRAPKGA